MELGIFIPSRVSQKKAGKYYITSYIYIHTHTHTRVESKIRHKRTFKKQKQPLRHGDRPVAAKRERVGDRWSGSFG